MLEESRSGKTANDSIPKIIIALGFGIRTALGSIADHSVTTSTLSRNPLRPCATPTRKKDFGSQLSAFSSCYISAGSPPIGSRKTPILGLTLSQTLRSTTLAPRRAQADRNPHRILVQEESFIPTLSFEVAFTARRNSRLRSSRTVSLPHTFPTLMHLRAAWSI